MQEETIKIKTNDSRVPVKASYAWKMRCRGGGSLTGSTVSSRFDGATTESFSGSGKYSADVGRKFEAEIRVRLQGTRESEIRFTGMFKLGAKVFEKRSGELAARCNAGIVDWTADRVVPAGP